MKRKHNNHEVQITYNPRKTRIEVTWDGEAFNYDVIEVGFRGWTDDPNVYEFTTQRGRCSTERLCELADRLLASYGGTLLINGREFATDAQRRNHPAGLVRTFKNRLRVVGKRPGY